MSHASTLKWLSLKHSAVPFSDSSLRELLTSYRDSLHLKGFELISHPSQAEIYEDDWQYDTRTDSTHVRALERFVLGEKESWPMTKDDDDSFGWERDCPSTIESSMWVYAD